MRGKTIKDTKSKTAASVFLLQHGRRRTVVLFPRNKPIASVQLPWQRVYACVWYLPGISACLADFQRSWGSFDCTSWRTWERTCAQNVLH